ncbi:hypothetical protein [Flexibacterium corallicola]|uniref:hypothetical protein n=1 Tax=Flexibacterium corallicola TaxID=3037259 RepID=UPI00286EB98C|nr:hypothetical protein [Pseudovibrio sp. M1P-2-3]
MSISKRMSVYPKCPKCGYENKISFAVAETGASVACTSCNNIFEVKAEIPQGHASSAQLDKLMKKVTKPIKIKI